MLVMLIYLAETYILQRENRNCNNW